MGGLRCGVLMVVLKVDGWIKVWGANGGFKGGWVD